MKRLTVLFILAFASINILTAQDDKVQFGFIFGASTPSDNIAQIYNQDRFSSDSLTGDGTIVNDALSTGYHLGARIRLKLTDNAYFIGGFSWHRFPTNTMYMMHPETNDTIASFENTTNIIPINAGINFYLIQSVVGVYATADLTYNMISTSTDYKYKKLDIPITDLELDPQDSRLGFGVGAGVDFNILFTGNLEVKYNYTNLIGKDDDEKDKAYLSVSLGIYF